MSKTGVTRALFVCVSMPIPGRDGAVAAGVCTAQFFIFIFYLLTCWETTDLVPFFEIWLY